MSSPQLLLNLVTTTGAGASLQVHSAKRSFQGSVSGSGAVSATIKIQVSNDNANWLDLATITLSGTTLAFDGGVADAPWLYMRGNVTALSGTGAAVTLALSATQ